MVKRVDRSSAFAKKLRISTEQRQQWTKDGGGFGFLCWLITEAVKKGVQATQVPKQEVIRLPIFWWGDQTMYSNCMAILEDFPLFIVHCLGW